MFLEPRTIAHTLKRVDQGLYVLPAIQREFVWNDRKIVALFDSLMRGYPIGGFLFWHVTDETVESTPSTVSSRTMTRGARGSSALVSMLWRPPTTGTRSWTGNSD